LGPFRWKSDGLRPGRRQQAALRDRPGLVADQVGCSEAGSGDPLLCRGPPAGSFPIHVSWAHMRSNVTNAFSPNEMRSVRSKREKTDPLTRGLGVVTESEDSTSGTVSFPS